MTSVLRWNMATSLLFAHPTSFGDIVLECYYGDDGQPEYIRIVQADPVILISGEFLRKLAAGAAHPKLPFAAVDRVEPGGILHIYGRNRTVVYVLTQFEPPTRPDGYRVPDTWAGEFPD